MMFHGIFLCQYYERFKFDMIDENISLLLFYRWLLFICCLSIIYVLYENNVKLYDEFQDTAYDTNTADDSS
jgi:hypothetical protein